MNTESSLEGFGSESQAGTKNLEFAEFEALLAFRGYIVGLKQLNHNYYKNVLQLLNHG